MDDAKYEFISDSAEKKRIGNSARHRRTHNGKRGGVKLPSDFLTKKERDAMSGECRSYRINEPMKWAEFKAMPEDIQRQYVQILRDRYGANNQNLSEMFRIARPAVSKHLKMLGMPSLKKGSRLHDKEGWEKFLNEGKQEPVKSVVQDQQPQEEDGTGGMEGSNSVCALVPDSGELVFHGSASDALDAVKQMLGGKVCMMKILWEREKVG